MSEHSEQFSRASSLSIFSGIGTSSVSGVSETGHVNVEDLSDAHLEQAVEELKGGLRLLILETLMFESYYDRLASGQESAENILQLHPSTTLGHLKD